MDSVWAAHPEHMVVGIGLAYGLAQHGNCTTDALAKAERHFLRAFELAEELSQDNPDDDLAGGTVLLLETLTFRPRVP
ncbi:MAG: hypothetical protein ACYC4U_32670 [Pirellulaceae bacterium]